MIQGHSEEQCYVKHPELYEDKKEKEVEKEAPKKAIGVNDKGENKENPSTDEGFMEPKKKNGGKQTLPSQKRM